MRWSGRRTPLVEELLTDVIAGFSFRHAQGLQPGTSGIKHDAGRLPDTHQIIPILPGQDEIVFAAIETTAKEWSPLVNSAAGGPQIDTSTVAGGQQIYRLPFAIRQNLMLIRRYIVTMVRMEEKALIAAAAFDTVATGNVGLVSGRQISL